MFQMALRRTFAILFIGSVIWSTVAFADAPTEWLVGFDKQWYKTRLKSAAGAPGGVVV